MGRGLCRPVLPYRSVEEGGQGRAGVGEPWPWETGSLLGLYFSNWCPFFWDFRGFSSSPVKEENFTFKLERETWKSGRDSRVYEGVWLSEVWPLVGFWFVFFVISLQLGRFS